MGMDKLGFREKIGYALGDGAANIAWRGVATFLFIFYTDVFGLGPVTVGILFLVARFSDGITDVLMGIVGDRTETKYGKFRPWILWTAIPLAVILSLLFTSPGFDQTGKIIYAYVTYLLFTLIYTANNIPYGALMAVMTSDNKERTGLGSFRMVGAFAGGMLVQGAFLFLVAYFGNINPTVLTEKIDGNTFKVTISATKDVENVNIKTKDGIAKFVWARPEAGIKNDSPTLGKSFSIKANKAYSLILTGEKHITPEKLLIVDQRRGYSRSMYLMSLFLAIFMLLTFYSTKERVTPPKAQRPNLKKDFKNLVSNRPWLVLLVVGLLFNVYNSIKQGMVIIYFAHFMNNQLLAASYLVGLMLASIGGAVLTGPLGKKLGKRRLFIYALIFSGAINALLVLCSPQDVGAIFTIGIISEVGAAIFPTLFFAMLGDVADYSEYKNGRRATGLIYSAGSFATKFGGGIAGAIIGMVLGIFHYNGQDASSVQGAIPGIIMLMSWIPAIVAGIAAIIMLLYPLTQQKLDVITLTLRDRRTKQS